jgi:hypothetical protein
MGIYLSSDQSQPFQWEYTLLCIFDNDEPIETAIAGSNLLLITQIKRRNGKLAEVMEYQFNVLSS